MVAVTNGALFERTPFKSLFFLFQGSTALSKDRRDAAGGANTEQTTPFPTRWTWKSA